MAAGPFRPETSPSICQPRVLVIADPGGSLRHKLVIDEVAGFLEPLGIVAPAQLNVRVLVVLRICSAESVLKTPDLPIDSDGVELKLWLGRRARQSLQISAALWYGRHTDSWHAGCGVVPLPLH